MKYRIDSQNLNLIDFYVFLDMELDCLSYSQMGPAELVIRSRDGEEMYLVISYKRGGKFFKLKVPKFFSTYFLRPVLFIKHGYGELCSIMNMLNPILFYFKFFRQVLYNWVQQLSASCPNRQHRQRVQFGLHCSSTSSLPPDHVSESTTQLVHLPRTVER